MLMKSKFTLALILIFIVHYSYAQFNNYATFTIPDTLLKNADAVIRDEYIKFTIKDINSAKYEVHQIITLLNEDANKYLSFSYHSSKFDILDDAEIIVYNALGIKQNKYSKKEMISLNYGDGLVPEGKLTYFNVTAPSYPITIETNYSVKYKGTLHYPSNYFQYPYQSVQHSVFEVESPADLSFRYKLLNCNYQPLISKLGNKDLYHWETKGLIAKKWEKHSGASENFIPMLLLAPNKFQMDEYDGDMSSWKNFGDWITKLYKKTEGLSPEKILFYKNLVKDAKSSKEKISIIYKNMQANMRYVSIQLGIGGWQPFAANFVDEKKFGDCKALSNYMKSALDAVGIKSNIVIIYRNNVARTIDEKFPVSSFNHAILNVPLDKDTVWLECTSTTLPFAQLDESTLNRKCLMITEHGGEVVNTPKSNYKDNTESYYTSIKVNDDFGAMVDFSYSTFGENRSYLTEIFHDKKADEKRKFFIAQFAWKQPDVLTITSNKKLETTYTINAEMEYEKIYAFKAGSKYFLEPRLFKIFTEDVPETDKRVNDYYFDYPYQTNDTTEYILMPNTVVETLPKSKVVNFQFATYQCTYNWSEATHKLTIISLLQIKQRMVKASEYYSLLNFKKQILADTNEKIVMKKN